MSRMERTFCDKCGNKILRGGEAKGVWRLGGEENEVVIDDGDNRKVYDFCNGCFNDFESLFDKWRSE